MPIHLTIESHGIGPFVISSDDKRAAVFLCDAPETVVPNQVTYVRFPRKNYPESNRRRPAGNEFSEFGHVLLDGERLSVVGAVAPADAELRIDRSDDPRLSTPTRRDRRSLIWLPTTEELAPGHGDLKSGYFSDPVNVTPRLIARVDFTQGRLGTTGVANVQVPFRSRDGSRSIIRPMARDIQLELEIESDHFFLRSDPFSGARNPANDLRFEGEGDIKIVIGNEPADDMELGTPPIVAIDVIQEEAAREWEFYFQLCERVPDDPLLPHLARRPGSLTGCSRPRYNSTDFGTTSALNLNPNEDAFALRAREEAETPPLPKWAVLAYMALDNDLVKVGQDDVDEMATADPANVSVVVQLDLPEKGTQRLVLGQDGLEPVAGPPVGNLNSGDPRTLSDFLIAAKKLRPSEYTVVCTASHGTGIRDVMPIRRRRRPVFDDEFITRIDTSFGRTLSADFRKILGFVMSTGFDETSADALDNLELEQGLRGALQSDGPFDILGFDACLMSLVEIGYQLRHCGRYMVSSQEDLASEGWPYEAVLSTFRDDVQPEDAVVAIVDAFRKSVKTQRGATLSAVDLNAMTPLARALDELGGSLVDRVAELIDPLAAARERARAFADFDYIDLCGFANAIESVMGEAVPAGRERDRVLAAAAAVQSELTQAVLATNLDPGQSRAHGLSAYVPNGPVIPEYHKLSISNDAPRWHDFVVAYGNSL